MKPPCGIFHDNVIFQWKDDLETLLRKIETSVTKIVFVNLPNTKHSLYFNVVSAKIVIGFPLSLRINNGKLDANHFSFRFFLVKAITSVLLIEISMELSFLYHYKIIKLFALIISLMCLMIRNYL